MRTLKEWFDSKLERLKSKGLHYRQEHVAPIYSFYLIMKSQYSDYHLGNWDQMFGEFYRKNYLGEVEAPQASEQQTPVGEQEMLNVGPNVSSETTSHAVEEGVSEESVAVSEEVEKTTDSLSTDDIEVEEKKKERAK